MAVLPDCRQPQPLAPERPEFTGAFGCTTAYNLGVMIADPADLERGRELDPADAERAGLSIQRYRVGEEEPLEDVGTTSHSAWLTGSSPSTAPPASPPSPAHTSTSTSTHPPTTPSRHRRQTPP